MTLLLWVAGCWLAAAIVVTTILLGARRSPLIYGWLFGGVPGAVLIPAAHAFPIAADGNALQRAA